MKSSRPAGSRTALGLRVLALLLGAASARGAQDKASEESAGQKYLERLGAAWAKELPPDQTLGIYFGRKWVGQASLTVKVAPAGEGASFEVNWKMESKVSGRHLATHDRILFGPMLSLVSAQSSEDGPEGKIARSLSVQESRWRVRREEKGKATYPEGPLRPGTTWNASFLPLFGRPEGPSVRLTALDGDQSPVVLAVPPEKKGAAAEGDPEPAGLLEVRRGAGAPGVWRFSPEGRPVEFRPGGSPVRLRPVSPQGAGKDLDEPLSLSEPAKALCELFRSIKRGDRPAVAAAFDFEKLAQDLVPGYADLDTPAKHQVVESLRSKTPTDLVSTRFRDSLPDEGLMEDFFVAGSEATEANGKAEVRLLEKGVLWKLYRVAEGSRKGRWVVCGIRS